MKTKDSSEKLDHKKAVYKASDVKKSAGLSYRQINDWDSKGALPSQRENKAGWRKFTAKEVFVMALCKSLRESFGVPLEKLSFVRKFMLQEKANHFRYSLEMIRDYGLNIYLLTDLKKTFIMDTDLEMEDLFNLGFFRCDDSQNFILMKVNPLVNQILAMKNIPPLKTSDVVYKQYRAFEMSKMTLSEQEKEALKLIRNKDFKKITLHTQKGSIIQADTEEELDAKEWDKKRKEINKLIDSHSYQSLMIQTHDDKIVRISKKRPFKVGKRQ